MEIPQVGYASIAAPPPSPGAPAVSGSDLAVPALAPPLAPWRLAEPLDADVVSREERCSGGGVRSWVTGGIARDVLAAPSRGVELEVPLLPPAPSRGVELEPGPLGPVSVEPSTGAASAPRPRGDLLSLDDARREACGAEVRRFTEVPAGAAALPPEELGPVGCCLAEPGCLEAEAPEGAEKLPLKLLGFFGVVGLSKADCGRSLGVLPLALPLALAA